ncbi:hyaluronan mrna-binding protein [Nannochloropsis oceanica]
MDNQAKEVHDPSDKKAHARPEASRGRQFERRSGTGREETQKKGGAGKANWGNELEDVDDIVREVHEELAGQK